MYNYKYDKEYQTLQQFDSNGILKASMQMPQDDLNAIAILDIKENILRNIDFAWKSEV